MGRDNRCGRIVSMWGENDELIHNLHYKVNKILLIAKHGFRKYNTSVLISILLLFRKCS